MGRELQQLDHSPVADKVAAEKPGSEQAADCKLWSWEEEHRLVETVEDKKESQPCRRFELGLLRKASGSVCSLHCWCLRSQLLV